MGQKGYRRWFGSYSYWFSPEEWVTSSEGYYKFEDGCQCTPHEFWQRRTEDWWNDGWSIWNE